VKHAAIGMTLAVLAATSSVAFAKDAGAAGNVEKAASFADGNVATIVAIGAGAATGIAVYVLGSSDGANATTSTATATSTAQ